LEEIAAQICERFEVSPDEAREDVQDFVQQLTQAHLAG
jgi:polyhydroxyalkanoate synthesis regulator phasin